MLALILAASLGQTVCTPYGCYTPSSYSLPGSSYTLDSRSGLLGRSRVRLRMQTPGYALTDLSWTPLPTRSYIAPPATTRYVPPITLRELPEYPLRRYRLYRADGAVEEFDAIDQPDGSLLRIP